MTRQSAWEILSKYLTNPTLIKHCLATEATMRALATRFDDDVDVWGITGLLHDADYEKSKGHPEEHGVLLFKFEPNAIPTVIEHAIEAHNYTYTNIMPESKMDWAITCCDQLTGIIYAAALTQKDKKLSSLTVDFVTEKLRQKDFALGANRDAIYLCEEKLGIPLGEFVGITLTAMQGVHEELGL
ncbi:MAG TPA: HD domain-containing protein [Candidatus Saccharimonadales bacterium]|nr:HD domain-containing protein [Candidatus Saccharimonadales bacterium]